MDRPNPRTGHAPRRAERGPSRSWRAAEGSCHPLGVSYVAAEDAYNFALYSKHAERVILMLYGADDAAVPMHSLTLDPLHHRTGRIWHCRIPCKEAKGARFYAYSIDGSRDPCRREWHTFDAAKVLLDPYATEIHVPPSFDRTAASAPGSNAGKAVLGVLCPREEPPQLIAPEERPRHEADLVIYELHVRGFTKHSSSPVPPRHRGTYAGVIDMIPYLVELGVTAVELMPVFQHDPQSGDFWGYSPMSFFAPHAAYATEASPGQVSAEFRRMTDTLHDAGIEVLLDVVYNHTAEGSDRGPTYSFKGIDNSTYYLCSGDPQQPYLDYTGTGNTLHCANRHVRRVILDSLRHWITEMRVDGFRFDLASIFARDSAGNLVMGDEATPIFGDIGADPLLANTRLIAEPWDAVGTYQLGRHFPGVEWHQWNGRFRDDVRQFVRGDAGMVPTMMYRLYGSDDLFPDTPPDVFHPYQSINYVSIHDGLTLRDLVTYERKHNQANGHDNADGPSESYSCNYGFEGEENVPPDIRALRERQAKNLLAIVFLANGVPMLRAGDEFLQTQSGNDNPYNQDNETSWLDWRLRTPHEGFWRFVRELIAFRKRHPTLCRSRYWREDVRWFGASGPVDLSPANRAFAYFLRGTGEGDADLYVVLNMAEHALPLAIQVGSPSEWRRVIDTARRSPEDIVAEENAPRLTSGASEIHGRSIRVFVREP